jgi:putative inorganic carbon (hco3(-)) transporter
MHYPSEKIKKLLFFGALLLLLFTMLNPVWKIDLVFIALFLLVIGHTYLREKLILVFLALRPVLDIWRDSTLLTYQQTSINVNAGLSIVVLVWGLWMLLPRITKLQRVPSILLMLLLVLLMGGSTLYSIAPLTTLIESIKFVVIALLFILAFLFVYEKKIAVQEILGAILLGAIVPILLGISQLFFGGGITTFGIRGRIFGTFAHPNVFAFFLLSLFFIHLEYAYIRIHDFWHSRLGQRHVISGLLLLLLIMTFTRGAWVGLAVFLLMIGALQYKKLLTWVLGISIGCYIIFFPIDALVRQYTGSSLQEYQIVQRLTARNEDSDSIAWRLALVEETIPIIAMRPILGYGYGTFELVWGDNRNMIHLWDDSAEAHNDYLRFSLELGIVGLVLYSLLLFLLLVRSGILYYEERDKEHTIALHLIAFILAFSAMSLADNMLHHTPVMWLTAVWWGAMFGVLEQEHIRTRWNFLR